MWVICVCMYIYVCAWMNTIDTHILSESYQEGNVQL